MASDGLDVVLRELAEVLRVVVVGVPPKRDVTARNAAELDGAGPIELPAAPAAEERPAVLVEAEVDDETDDASVDGAALPALSEEVPRLDEARSVTDRPAAVLGTGMFAPEPPLPPRSRGATRRE
jgi:hypothetical protein